jgi:peptidoglycan/xylan/chitin deacetylase (PgdA/CDA1 family)
MTRAFDAAILTYHSISEGPPPLCFPPDVFAKQMHWLRQNARVLSLTDLTGSLAGGSSPRRAVALTFDDGFRDFYDTAAPTLRRLGLPATVFLPAGYCGKKSDWDIHTGGRPVLSWGQVRELAEQGFVFGSHGMSHTALAGRTDAELTHEVAESRRLMEEETGREIRFFCYPYGSHDAGARRAVSACYSGGACSSDLRGLGPGDDRYALPRIDIHYMRRPAIFRAVFTQRFRLYLFARRFIRNIRARTNSPAGGSIS